MKRNIIAAVLSAAVIISGCSREVSYESLPEDNPANHGSTPIMETEKGYYSNYAHIGGSMYLRFYERDTENQVFLCAKPECQHDGGEMCVATQKADCIGTILYNGQIYVLAIDEEDETVSYNLYRAALDGSSLDKVGSAFSVNNSSDQEYRKMENGFIIHKGYAYIPYHLSFGDSSFGFAGSGLVKMNIFDGSSETLISGENYFSPYPQELQGSGDYVYYNFDSAAYRYNINSGESEKILDKWYTSVGREKYYVTETRASDGKMATEISSYDKESGEKTVLRSDNVKGIYYSSPQLLPYEDKIIIGTGGNIYVYSENGELLAEADNFYKDDVYGQERASLKISEDKLYEIVPVEVEDGTDIYDWIYNYEVYSCPIENLIAGNTEKKLEYKVKNYWITEREFGRDPFKS